MTMIPFSTELLYLVAAALFILGIRDLSSAETARRGNMLAAIGMLLAIVGTLQHGLIVRYEWIIAGMVIGGLIGLLMAVFMPMTAMPERIAIVNGLGGAASCLVGVCEYYRHVINPTTEQLREHFDAFHVGVAGFEVMLGALTILAMSSATTIRALVATSAVASPSSAGCEIVELGSPIASFHTTLVNFLDPRKSLDLKTTSIFWSNWKCSEPILGSLICNLGEFVSGSTVTVCENCPRLSVLPALGASRAGFAPSKGSSASSVPAIPVQSWPSKRKVSM